MMTTKVIKNRKIQFPKSHPYFLLMKPSVSLMLCGFAALVIVKSNSVFNIIYRGILRVFTNHKHKDVSGHNSANEESHL